MADSTLLDRRVMAVKIDNHRDARPQSAIQEAEAVFELLVEGGLTRFLALFHSVDSSYVGPIRSVRSTELTLLPSLDATLQISNSWPPVLAQAEDLGVDFITQTRATTFRIDTRPAPHNLFGDTTAMRDYANDRGYPDNPPQPMFVFGEPATPDAPAGRITLNWSGGNVIHWEYHGERYLRFQGSSPHNWVDQEGSSGQIAFDTLLVLVTDRHTSISNPSFNTLGNGRALLFYDGMVIDGTWLRSEIDEPFMLTTGDGESMVVPRGRIWISVFPSDRAVSWE